MTPSLIFFYLFEKFRTKYRHIVRVLYCVCVLQLLLTLRTVQKVTSFPHICILTVHTENDLISPCMYLYSAYKRWPPFLTYVSLQCIQKITSFHHVCIFKVHATSFLYVYIITEYTDDLISRCMHAYSAHRRWPKFFTYASLQWIFMMTSFLHVCILTMHTEDDLISPRLHLYSTIQNWYESYYKKICMFIRFYFSLYCSLLKFLLKLQDILVGFLYNLHDAF